MSSMILRTQHILKQFVYTKMSLKSELWDKSHPCAWRMLGVARVCAWRAWPGGGELRCLGRAPDLSCVNISLKPSPHPAIRPSQTSEKSGALREEDCHVSRETKCVHVNSVLRWVKITNSAVWHYHMSQSCDMLEQYRLSILHNLILNFAKSLRSM